MRMGLIMLCDGTDLNFTQIQLKKKKKSLTMTPATPIPTYPMMWSFSLKKFVIAIRQS